MVQEDHEARPRVRCNPDASQKEIHRRQPNNFGHGDDEETQEIQHKQLQASSRAGLTSRSKHCLSTDQREAAEKAAAEALAQDKGGETMKAEAKPTGPLTS
uniref:Uncharacterized protein n=1 Tax=Peronospora matthiolae TaxID=2874970 RepID=A0AAV1TYF8_9STRA